MRSMFTVHARHFGNCDRYTFRATDCVKVERIYRDVAVTHNNGRLTVFRNVRYADWTGNRPVKDCYGIVLEKAGFVEF